MRLGLIGPPQSGKTTVFSAITGRVVDPAAAVQEQMAAVPMPDPRLEWVAQEQRPKRVTPASLEFVDVPGFSLATAHGRAEFLRHVPSLRQCDGLVAVVRGFADPSVPAYRDRIDPAADLKELHEELLFADLEQVTNRLDRLDKQVRKPTGRRDADKHEMELLRRCQEALEQEQPLLAVSQSEEEAKLLRSFAFLTEKPLVAVLNVSEQEAANPPALEVAAGRTSVSLCAKLEAEIAQLAEADRGAFLSELGISEPAGPRLTRACYEGLGLISFFTCNEQEARAWSVPRGIKALEAAGKIHTDIARGFIRAEVVAFEDLRAADGFKQAKAIGKIRLEGKEYEVQDGDVILFRFNV
jgi:GTP-binding protein YchF